MHLSFIGSVDRLFRADTAVAIYRRVKPTAHGRDASGLSVSLDVENPSPETLRAINNSLSELIRWAYRVKEYQVSGRHR